MKTISLPFKARTAMTAVAMTAGVVLALSAASANAQTKVKFTLDWVFQGPTSPLLLAVEKGYYKAEGLDVSVDAGQGSAGALQRVATGAYEMGFADINALIEYNVANPDKPVKAVMMAYDAPPFGVYALKKSGIKGPKDLEGKKLGAPVFDASFKLFPAWAAKVGIDNSKVIKVNMDPRLRETSLINGDVEVISGHYFSSVLDLKARGVKMDDIVAMPYADFGMDFYGNAIIASPDMIAKQGDAVKGFVKATIKAWLEVIADPKAGIAAAKKRDPLIDEAVEMERLTMSIQRNVVTKWVKENGLGDVDMKRLAASAEAVAKAVNLKATPKAEDLFTSAFLPPKADRMVK